MAKSDKQTQTIEQLKGRYEKLNTEKVVLQDRKTRAEQELSKLKQQAVEQFGTDDLEALQQQLDQLKKQNETGKIRYQEQLDQIEQQLEDIDDEFEEVNSGIQR